MSTASIKIGSMQFQQDHGAVLAGGHRVPSTSSQRIPYMFHTSPRNRVCGAVGCPERLPRPWPWPSLPVQFMKQPAASEGTQSELAEQLLVDTHPVPSSQSTVFLARPDFPALHLHLLPFSCFPRLLLLFLAPAAAAAGKSGLDFSEIIIVCFVSDPSHSGLSSERIFFSSCSLRLRQLLQDLAHCISSPPPHTHKPYTPFPLITQPIPQKRPPQIVSSTNPQIKASSPTLLLPHSLKDRPLIAASRSLTATLPSPDSLPLLRPRPWYRTSDCISLPALPTPASYRQTHHHTEKQFTCLEHTLFGNDVEGDLPLSPHTAAPLTRVAEHAASLETRGQ
ncbi:hypothetical protein HYFRA_00010075 [Hymenoscyphus fraxineus]|uniref:Uncharacterized protein n=1 Tax=Hymenoscyphus fraxineus TaxID=746836 RepID=A0A9N9PNK2_9HELO|nr:hypothetical protein HYFRA_00010075 [Hymenoscyphus fraxineus]